MADSTISEILRDTNYSLDLFRDEEITNLENSIFLKKEKPYIKCIIRDKDILLKPEEVVRHLYTRQLIKKPEFKDQFDY